MFKFHRLEHFSVTVLVLHLTVNPKMLLSVDYCMMLSVDYVCYFISRNLLILLISLRFGTTIAITKKNNLSTVDKGQLADEFICVSSENVMSVYLSTIMIKTLNKVYLKGVFVCIGKEKYCKLRNGKRRKKEKCHIVRISCQIKYRLFDKKALKDNAKGQQPNREEMFQ